MEVQSVNRWGETWDEFIERLSALGKWQEAQLLATQCSEHFATLDLEKDDAARFQWDVQSLRYPAGKEPVRNLTPQDYERLALERLKLYKLNFIKGRQRYKRQVKNGHKPKDSEAAAADKFALNQFDNGDRKWLVALYKLDAYIKGDLKSLAASPAAQPTTRGAQLKGKAPLGLVDMSHFSKKSFEKTDMIGDITFAFAHMYNNKVKMREAPSPAAWSMLLYAREFTSDFLSKMLPKLTAMKDKKEDADNENFEDEENFTVLSTLLEKMQSKIKRDSKRLLEQSADMDAANART